LLAEVESCFRLIADEPFAGPERDDLARGLRFLPVGNYLIFYLPLSDCVEIVRVIHGPGLWSGKFLSVLRGALCCLNASGTASCFAPQPKIVGQRSVEVWRDNASTAASISARLIDLENEEGGE
jgi:hypothetical protein